MIIHGVRPFKCIRIAHRTVYHLQGVRIVPTLAALFAVGAVIGPPLDSLHSSVDLLIYDKFPVTIGAMHFPLYMASASSGASM